MSRTQAIKEKCTASLSSAFGRIDCIYDPLEVGTNLAQVEKCTFTECSLYPYRPIPKASKPKGAPRTMAQLAHIASMNRSK